ncbi:hypothetical protein O2K51_01690 [Apibacter raozihei]|uniref:hypothetical protein n=1 Tax=Apibacter raozihei TaxID=2500547 RepID=UPI000FE328AF|nr:hypothetical protein [Apibacter raozihei]
MILLLVNQIHSYAQEKAVDLVNFNLSVIGVGIQYEKALTEKITALGTIDYSGGFGYNYNGYDEGFDYMLTTRLSLEGRYYYNFESRASKGKNTANNSGNYLSLKLTILPDWLTSSSNNWKINPQGSLSFNYGLKRSFAKNFFYELYAGPGVSMYSESNYKYNFALDRFEKKKETKIGAMLDYGFRIGYNF